MNSSVTEPVDAQLRAYNARDIDGFISAYAEGAKIVRLPDTPTLNGLPAIRERYQRLFDGSPELKAIVHQRTVVGDWVVDYETVTGANMAGVGPQAVVAYQVVDGKIINVFVMK